MYEDGLETYNQDVINAVAETASMCKKVGFAFNLFKDKKIKWQGRRLNSIGNDLIKMNSFPTLMLDLEELLVGLESIINDVKEIEDNNDLLDGATDDLREALKLSCDAIARERSLYPTGLYD